MATVAETRANKIERVWLDPHANVTRNHRRGNIDELMRAVSAYLAARNARSRPELRKAT